MSTEGEQGWNEAFAKAAEALSRWRKEHPLATFNEIEDARDRFMRPVMARMTADVATAVPAEMRIGRCPDCQARLQRAGMRGRELLSGGGLEIHLEREYTRCPACGWAGSPPR